jgi:hypothetical protein
MKKQIRDIFIIILITVILLEVVLRILGYQPYYFPPFSIISDPVGSLIPHEEMGLALQPGIFHVTMNDSLHYQTIRLQDSTRFVGESNAKSTIEFHGCSFTYGMAVDTDKTFGYLLQEKIHDFTKIKNKAVPGYGNIQGLLSLQKSIQNKDSLPDTIIMFYADFHNERNVLSPYYREHLHYGFMNMDDDTKERFKNNKKASFPYAYEENGALKINHSNTDKLFNPLPFREYSALINTIQNAINLKKHQNIDSKNITQLLLLEMDRICKENDIEFIVASIVKNEATQSMLLSIRQNNVTTLDMGLDILQDTTYNNMPYDSHPNELAHRIYVERLHHYLNYK